MKINSYINRYDNFLDNDLRDALLLETFSYRRKWKKLDELKKKSDGSPSRKLFRSPIGKRGGQFLNSDCIRGLVSESADKDLKLNLSRSCINVFNEKHHYIEPHVDGKHCQFVLLAYLKVQSEKGSLIRIYPNQSLTEVRERPSVKIDIPLKEGSILFFEGSKLVHERPCIKDNETIISLAACFIEQ
ncbi:MAG: hypothetical protein ACSHW0_17065 [Thalassotalea sp.]